MHILIVEDNEDNRRLLLKRLRGLGHQLREAASGQAALKAIRLEVPELILLDLQLPDMPGSCSRASSAPIFGSNTRC